MSALSDVISKARDRVQDYRDRRVRLTESDTIRVLILPVLESLGWDLQDVEEVRSEYRHAPADNPVDYALFLHGSPSLFVEAKALGVSLDDRKPLLQTLNYANAAGVDWCVLTNGSEWRIYKVHAPVAAEEKLFLTVRVGEAGADTGAMAATLSLLSRDRMRVRAIDALWSEWRVDRAVERVLNTVTQDDAFIRLITKRADGLTLTIKDRPDSAAKVVDGKRVEFRGEVISFNDWGCRATGWTAIQIYKWAVLPDGRLLEALRGVTE